MVFEHSPKGTVWQSLNQALTCILRTPASLKKVSCHTQSILLPDQHLLSAVSTVDNARTEGRRGQRKGREEF
eukprot:1957960-Pleurochrysis_carterae.AAC.1